MNEKQKEQRRTTMKAKMNVKPLCVAMILILGLCPEAIAAESVSPISPNDLPNFSEEAFFGRIWDVIFLFISAAFVVTAIATVFIMLRHGQFWKKATAIGLAFMLSVGGIFFWLHLRKAQELNLYETAAWCQEHKDEDGCSQVVGMALDTYNGVNSAKETDLADMRRRISALLSRTK